MRRRSRAGGEPAKTRRRKAATLKRGNATKATSRRSSSAVGKEERFARLTRELNEALARQTATTELLHTISNSRGELEPVFQSILENATRLCGANFSILSLHEGNAFRTVAMHNAPPAFAELRRREPVIRPRPLMRMAATKQLIHVADITEHSELHDPDVAAFVALTGVRTILGVPMLKDNGVTGVIVIYRKKVQPFTEKQIELMQNFASQAVIAIENARLLNELRESLQQQTATADVLKIISRSTFNPQVVLNTLVESAAQLCEADMAAAQSLKGSVYEHMAAYGLTPEQHEHIKTIKFEAGRGTVTGRILLEGNVVHVHDLRNDPEYILTAVVENLGTRTIVGVPLLRGGVPIGVFVLMRRSVRPFTKKQIELLSTYADQAVIAIENVRLLNELRQRTDDLTELLEQQTATSDVLRVISSSPGDLQPVFEAMLENAVRICDAKFGGIYRIEGDTIRLVSTHSDVPAAYAGARRFAPFRPSTKHYFGRMMAARTVLHIVDTAAEEGYVERRPEYVAAVELGGVRTFMAVPMLKENEPIGAFLLARQEVRPFTDKQIDLVKNFASQAVIAIENGRLLTELRQRTADLTELLEQQTATSEVLRVISSSPSDLDPVFQTMLTNATRLCEAKFGILHLYEDGGFPITVTHNVPDAFAALRRREPKVHFGPTHPVGRTVATKQVLHIADIRTEVGYLEGDPSHVAFADLAGGRTLIVVPMLKENDLVGVISIFRQEVRPFTNTQIELVQNFAAQAVIAIENTRLLSELRQRTDELGRSVDELRALGEVSQAVNSTLDLENVLSTIVAKAVQLSGTEAGAIYVFDDMQGKFYLRATYGMDQELIDTLTRQHIGLDETNVAQALAQREPVQIADLNVAAPSAVNDIILRAGYRALLVAPLLRGEDIVGMLVVRRKTSGAFPQNTVDLIKTFAAQSAVAIENARLFQNIEVSLKDLRTAQDRLVQTEKLASLGQLTAGIAHEIKNPLNFVNNFSAVSVELIDELRDALGGARLDSKLRTEINEIANMLQSNLDKVVQHGQRANSIVKNMLLHSRQGSGEHRPVDINALVEESLNLAYHGARAEKQGFNITMERSFDPAAGQVDLFPQDITRVLLNLISNGFYAATKRKAEANRGNCEPTLAAATKNLGDRVEIRIRDNGTGIPPEVKEKMFNPFFTTKPAGEGTGLGLSISHDIIVKQHGGSIEVDTQPGSFTEFRIVLPRAGAYLIKSGERM